MLNLRESDLRMMATALLAAAHVSRQEGHTDQANELHNICDNVNKELERIAAQPEDWKQQPVPMRDMTVAGNALKAVAYAASAYRGSLDLVGLVSFAHNDWSGDALDLERIVGNIQRKLEKFAKDTGRQLYMME